MQKKMAYLAGLQCFWYTEVCAISVCICTVIAYKPVTMTTVDTLVTHRQQQDENMHISCTTSIYNNKLSFV